MSKLDKLFLVARHLMIKTTQPYLHCSVCKDIIDMRYPDNVDSVNLNSWTCKEICNTYKCGTRKDHRPTKFYCMVCGEVELEYRSQRFCDRCKSRLVRVVDFFTNQLESVSLVLDIKNLRSAPIEELMMVFFGKQEQCEKCGELSQIINNTSICWDCYQQRISDETNAKIEDELIKIEMATRRIEDLKKKEAVDIFENVCIDCWEYSANDVCGWCQLKRVEKLKKYRQENKCSTCGKSVFTDIQDTEVDYLMSSGEKPPSHCNSCKGVNKCFEMRKDSEMGVDDYSFDEKLDDLYDDFNL